jgi:hypothetical protein
MKEGATLSYSHGFNIVEEGMQIRKDLTVIMVAPNVPVPKSVQNTFEVLEYPHLLPYIPKMILREKDGQKQKPIVWQLADIKQEY